MREPDSSENAVGRKVDKHVCISRFHNTRRVDCEAIREAIEVDCEAIRGDYEAMRVDC